jgi:putative long chain acyl-CoA synthase
MPRGLWRRVQTRFKPARVLEFYASTEAGAILVNVKGTKEGSMGRPLPGSAEVRIGGYDAEAGTFIFDAHGFVRECGTDEVGMLLARVRADETTSTATLRGAFAAGDAWLPTGDLFRRDSDGDYWRLDGVADVIRTVEGPVFTAPIRDALSDLAAVDLAVAYGVPVNGAERELAVAAVTLRPRRKLDAKDLAGALKHLERPQRPAIVRVVDRIPVTTWFRPMTAPLREEGIPEPGDGLRVWYLDAGGEHYRRLTGAAHRRLAGRAVG